MSEYTQRPGSEYTGTSRESEANDMGQAREQAQETGENVLEKAQEFGHQAQQRAEEGKDQAAQGMERAAESLRDRVSENGGIASDAGVRAADAMDSAAGYLRSHDTSEMWSDVETYAKAHPTKALAGAIFAGFILGRIIR